MDLNKILFMLICCVTTLSCSKKENNRNNSSIPSLTTIIPTLLSPTKATSGGNITDDHGSNITARGVCWSTVTNPTLSNNKTTDGTGFGTFSSTLTGLLVNTTYYVRAYATNSNGTGYGNELSFKTATIPSISNIDITNIHGITKSAASVSVSLISDGGSPILQKGLYWSRDSNLTDADDSTNNGTGSGSFVANISGLNPATKYYVRAYATNVYGTAFSNSTSFISLGSIVKVTDIDGNIYNTVQIGTQTWMVENLKTTRYNDGTPIPNVITLSQWNTLTTGAWCYFQNNTTWWPQFYGKFYNWYAVNTGLLAPIGWHVPTDADWDILINYLGGSSVAGGKMKSTDGWVSPHSTATNSSGFSALAAGIWGPTSSGGDPGWQGYWWSSTSLSSTQAIPIGLRYNTNVLNRNWVYKYYGVSVRCIKN